ncbi:unnamed protein product [Alopecurus aequalis]
MVAAESRLPAPPPQEQGDTAKDGNESKDSAMENPPLQTDMADPGPRRSQTAPTEASGSASPPTEQQTGTGEAAPGTSQLTRTASQEKTVAAGAENHLAAQEQGDTAKDSAMENPRQAEAQKPGPSRWPRVRSPVLFLLSLFRLRLGKQGQHPRMTPPPTEDDGAGEPATEKDKGEGSMRHRNEAEASMSASGRKDAASMKPPQTNRHKSPQALPPEGVVGSEVDAKPSPMKRKLQNACRLVKNTMSWYGRHRSPANAENTKEEAVPKKEKLPETKPSPEEAETKSKQDDKMDQSTLTPESSRRWEEWGEKSLEEILENACMRLVEAEFGKRLDPMKQQGLLTFSVFPLGSQVKKQAVTYWWSTWFQLPPEKRVGKADEIFSDLSDGGFLEPIKIRGGVIHGCQVNPLVHWMVKRKAREKDLADLDDLGDPADVQPKSQILCLTPGNRDQMQKLRDDDDSPLKVRIPTQVPPDGIAPSQEQQAKSRLDAEMDQKAILHTYGKKKVILNISSHVYRLPNPLLIKLADQLEVLQLGRWGNSDDETYMEVEALESLSAMGKLKNLRYVSLRGLSRLMELPAEVRRLRRLAILDARGCQNLVCVPSATVQKLKGLTHLDLTECYMLEHIGRGVSTLSELRVFKGFIFGVGKRRRDACRLQHLTKLKKLRKLNVNVTTDANVEKDEMKQLGNLAGVVSLTVTWGERPSVLLDDSRNDDRLEKLLDTWTGLVLPPSLEKLDVRCYPRPELPVETWLKGQRGLKKLYVRGGEVEKLAIPVDNKIETLRLRYLNQFRMEWTTELFPKLDMNNIVCVEVVDKDLKVMRNESKGKGDMVKDEPKTKKIKEDQELIIPIKKRMKIPESTIDENGVWVKDPKDAAGQDTAKEESGKAEKGDDGKGQTEVKGKQSGLKGESGQAAEEDRGDTSERKEVDGGDKYHETVKEEKDHMKKAIDEEHDIIKKDATKHESNVDENKMKERDKKEQKENTEKRASPTLAIDQTVAPASDRDIKEGAIMDQTETEKISEIREESQDRTGGSRGQDEPPTKEDEGDVGEIRKLDSSDDDDPQEGEGKGGGKVKEHDDGIDVSPTALPPTSTSASPVDPDQVGAEQKKHVTAGEGNRFTGTSATE